MKIIRLTAENIKRLKAVEITPDGNMVVIGGRNAQGKTSVLDSITYALAGTSSHPDQPIRNGEDKAKIVCELDDLIVTRTFTLKGGSLKVSNKEGAKYASPQALLDELTGKLTFDPLAFARMQPQEQLETLRSLVGLDFAEMDAKRQELYDKRTVVNREGKELKGAVDQMTKYPDVPDDEVSVSELMDELRIREAHNRANNEAREKLNELSNQRYVLAQHAFALEKELEETKAELDKANQQAKARKELVDARKDTDEEEIREQITGADLINRKVRSNRVLTQRERELEDKRSESRCISEAIAAIDTQRADAVASADFPVCSLSFDDNAVLYKGLPFDQCSSSEQLRVSLAMGLAMNPKLKVVLIRDGSLLDKDNLKMIAEMAAAADAQVWLEKVGEGDDISIIIEDGMVKEYNEWKEAKNG